MFRSLMLAIVLLATTPFIANAEDITLLPAVKLHLGDRDNLGHYWDGGRWRDRDDWHRHYEWRNNHWHHHDRDRNRHNDYDRGYRRGWHDREERRREWHRGPDRPPHPPRPPHEHHHHHH